MYIYHSKSNLKVNRKEEKYIGFIREIHTFVRCSIEITPVTNIYNCFVLNIHQKKMV